MNIFDILPFLPIIIGSVAIAFIVLIYLHTSILCWIYKLADYHRLLHPSSNNYYHNIHLLIANIYQKLVNFTIYRIK